MMQQEYFGHPFTDPKAKAHISKYIAMKQVKKGILKGYDLIKKKEEINISKAIGPPDLLTEPFDNKELKAVAFRLQDLGYYHEKIPDKEEIEYTLAPNYLGIIGMASDNEQNSLQGAIKKFQCVHGFSLNNCDGRIDAGDETLEKLNSKLVVPLISYTKSLTKGIKNFYNFEDDKDNHLHPVLHDFMDDVHWFFSDFVKEIKLAKMKGKVKGKYAKMFTQEINNNLARNVVISHASKGYPGDGHKNPKSEYYKGKAIEITAINNVNVSDAEKEPRLLPFFEGIPAQFREIAITSFKASEGSDFITGLYSGPVMAFAEVLNAFKEKESELPFKWQITQLDTPWHGDRENHQDHISVAVESKGIAG